MIFRVRRGGVDEYGDPLPVADRYPLEGAFVAPRTSDAVENRGRDGAVIGLTLFAPFDADLVRTDQVEVDGELYRIDGDVGRWRHPMTGWEAGATAALVRAEG